MTNELIPSNPQLSLILQAQVSTLRERKITHD